MSKNGTDWRKSFMELYIETKAKEDEDTWDLVGDLEDAIVLFRDPNAVGDLLDWENDDLKRKGIIHLIDRDPSPEFDVSGYVDFWFGDLEEEARSRLLVPENAAFKSADICRWLDEVYPAELPECCPESR